jgi:DNA-binding SARP family transcriptional activator/Tfp pilus assembly protein PilF
MQFQILGPLEVRVGGSWSGINAPKWRTVLAVLLLQPSQIVSTDQLINEVWPEDAPARATNLISVYVHRLRRLIGDPEGKILVTRSPGYQLLAAADDVDAQLFARLMAAGRGALADQDAPRAADLLSQAAGLWRGNRALADVPPSPLVSAEASRLEECLIEVVELRIQADLACGRQAQVVTELRRLLADHPLRERLWALLMRALYRSGRQAEALEVYAQARKVIADELGVDPGAELQGLYQQILAADSDGGPAGDRQAGPVPAVAVPHAPLVAENPAAIGVPAEPALAARALPLLAQLPADIADFTGRAEHVATLRAMLSSPQRADSPGAVVLAAVVGAGGLGKTTLAVHAAHLLRGRFPDGQLYANLLGAAPRPAPPAEILARFLRDLGVDPGRIPANEEERAAQYHSQLVGRRVLIVLDDAKDAAQVRPLLPGSASCAVLVTSRSRLPDLAGSRVVDLNVLQPAEARELFATIVGAARAAAEPQATRDVLAACAGLPLAIRIAGARLAARGNWSVRSMADRLSDERRRLDELSAGDLAVRACFEVSFTSLPGPARGDGVNPATAFRLLGVWAGLTIGLRAATALLGEPADAVADALEVLVDAQLLQSPAADRYRFHDLLRAYAAERALAEEPGEARLVATQRVLTWYLHTVEAVAQLVSPHRYRIPLPAPGPECLPLSFGTLTDALNWCEAERANLVAGIRQAAASGLHDLAWRLAVACFVFFNRRTYWADWVETHRVALASARQTGDKRAEALVLNNLGSAFIRQGRDAAAADCFEQALAIRRKIGDLPGEAQTATNIADSYLRQKRFDEALDLLKRVLEIERELASPYSEGVVLNNLGEVFLAMGRDDEAVASLEQAGAIFRDIGEIHGEGYALTNLGEAYLAIGRTAEAIGVLEDALELHQASADHLDEVHTLRDLGRAHLAAGHRDQGRDCLQQAAAMFTELGDDGQASAIQAELIDLGRNDHDPGPDQRNR